MTLKDTFRVLQDLLSENDRDGTQVDAICKLLATTDLGQVEDKSEGLLVIQMFLRNSRGAPNVNILKQFALSGFFNIEDENSGTALHRIACKYNFSRLPSRMETLKMIINHGGNPSIANRNGDNVLHSAVMFSDTVAITAILEDQPKPSPLLTSRNFKGLTPMRNLILARQSIRFETLKLLVDFGADINETDEFGNSLLHVLYSNCKDGKRYFERHSNFARMFVELGADVNAINNLNQVPLRVAMDSKIEFRFVKPLIPCLDILNDDSY